MFSNYGGFEDAFGDYGILDDLGLPPEVVAVIPSVAGGIVAFGATWATKKFIFKDPTSWGYQNAPLIGALGGIGAGLALWKYQGKGAGIAAMATGALVGLGLWLMPKIEVAALQGYGAYVTDSATPLLQAYEIDEAQPLLQEAPDLLSEAPDLLSDYSQPQVMSGWSPAYG